MAHGDTAAYRVYQSFVATATTHSLRFQVEEPNVPVFIEYLAMKNVDASGDLCAAGIEAGGLFIPQQTQVLTTADYWYGFHLNSWIWDGEALRFDFSGITIGNTIRCAAAGYIDINR